jgi:hypothetical protein
MGITGFIYCCVEKAGKTIVSAYIVSTRKRGLISEVSVHVEVKQQHIGWNGLA